MRFRIIPCLLLSGKGLVKTRKFRDPVYIGDPINTARIFSDKEVDEIMLLDIAATVEKKEPDYKLVEAVAGECFMPMAYGGGINDMEQVNRLIRCGIEKVVVNSAAFSHPELIGQIADHYGSQAVVGAIDVVKRKDQYLVTTHSGRNLRSVSPHEHARFLEASGCGEILVNNVDRDGTREGYDLDLLSRITREVAVPVVASGGAGKFDDFTLAIEKAGVAAVAAGSLMVFYGKRRGVLITYPTGHNPR